VGCWRGHLSGARCRLAYGPADATATHCLLLPLNPDWFTLLVPAHPGSPGKRAVKWMCVHESNTYSARRPARGMRIVSTHRTTEACETSMHYRRIHPERGRARFVTLTTKFGHVKGRSHYARIRAGMVRRGRLLSRRCSPCLVIAAERRRPCAETYFFRHLFYRYFPYFDVRYSFWAIF